MQPMASLIPTKLTRLLGFRPWFAVALALFLPIELLSVSPTAFAQERSESLLSRALKNRENSSVKDAVAENLKQTFGENTSTEELASKVLGGPDAWLSPKGLSSSLQILLLLTILSLAPAILLMTTCYVRIIVVFGLLKQALGAQQLPPSQVITSIALFITGLDTGLQRSHRTLHPRGQPNDGRGRLGKGSRTDSAIYVAPNRYGRKPRRRVAVL